MEQMITDRNIEDLAYLKNMLSKGYDAMTDEEKTWFAQNIKKGSYGASDLNRVTAAFLELIDQFLSNGTILKVSTRKADWTDDDTPTKAQMELYLENIRELKRQINGDTELPESMRFLTLGGANAIEKLILEVPPILERLEYSKMYAGEVIAGE